MPPSGVDYASEFLNGYAPEYVMERKIGHNQKAIFTVQKRLILHGNLMLMKEKLILFF